jgi:hypothetical protein
MDADDYESVSRAGRVLHEQGWRKAFSLNEMLAMWRALVSHVEAGYDEMVDEYTNDLTCRDWLALAWPMFTERVQTARQDELDSLDSRFLAATGEDTNAQLGRFFRVESKDGWWWRRIPTRRFGAFAGDLDA